ncbi:MAG: hypothetical protein ACR2N3_15020 [Pyrinomonadaceae bacterium]
MKNKLYGLAKKDKVSYRLLICLVVISMFPLFFISRNLFIGLAQTINKSDKKLTKEIFRNEPIEIINLKSNGKQFNLAENPAQENNRSRNFTVQDNDWFKDFTIDFKNISGRPIIYVNIAVKGDQLS